jgi:hypothetical protein
MVEGIVKRDEKRRKRIQAAGIDYECPALVSSNLLLVNYDPWNGEAGAQRRGATGSTSFPLSQRLSSSALSNFSAQDGAASENCSHGRGLLPPPTIPVSPSWATSAEQAAEVCTSVLEFLHVENAQRSMSLRWLVVHLSLYPSFSLLAAIETMQNVFVLVTAKTMVVISLGLNLNVHMFAQDNVYMFASVN